MYETPLASGNGQLRRHPLDCLPAQINRWEDHERFDGWMAVSTVGAGQEDPVVGALHFTAETMTNLEQRIVVAHNFEIVEANFPALDEVQTSRMIEAAESLLPDVSREIQLDRVLAHFERVDARPPELELSTDPPPERAGATAGDGGGSNRHRQRLSGAKACPRASGR